MNPLEHYMAKQPTTKKQTYELPVLRRRLDNQAAHYVGKGDPVEVSKLRRILAALPNASDVSEYISQHFGRRVWQDFMDEFFSHSVNRMRD